MPKTQSTVKGVLSAPSSAGGNLSLVRDLRLLGMQAPQALTAVWRPVSPQGSAPPSSMMAISLSVSVRRPGTCAPSALAGPTCATGFRASAAEGPASCGAADVGGAACNQATAGPMHRHHGIRRLYDTRCRGSLGLTSMPFCNTTAYRATVGCECCQRNKPTASVIGCLRASS